MHNAPTLRVIGDIHGEPAAVARAILSMNTPVILLGDLIDGGKDNASVLWRFLRYRKRRRIKLIRSNHDDKLYRHFIGRNVQIGEELAQTLSQIERARDRAYLKNGFNKAYEDAYDWLHMPPYFFAHGAFHPEMLNFQRLADVSNGKLRSQLRWLSLYAEGRANPDGGLPIRTYEWVATVPHGLTVVVGHDRRSHVAPVIETNSMGGRAIFLDTGCGKGGQLSWIDLPEEIIGQYRLRR